MNELIALLAAFHDATGATAAVWLGDDVSPSDSHRLECPRARHPRLDTAPRKRRSANRRVAERRRARRAHSRPAPRLARRGPVAGAARAAGELHALPHRVVAQYLQSALEVEHAANELAERYEEINLLYTISEILGRTVVARGGDGDDPQRSLRDGRRAARIDSRARPRDEHAARRRGARRRCSLDIPPIASTTHAA